jgi:hypothetical protein
MTETTTGHPAKTLLSDILAIVNRHQGLNAEQAMAEIEEACLASIDRPAPEGVSEYADYDARSRAEVIALISRQAKRIAALERVADADTEAPTGTCPRNATRHSSEGAVPGARCARCTGGQC